MRYTRLISIMVCTLLMMSSVVYAKKVYVSHQGGEDIFRNQFNTGAYANYNCAPTSMAMIEMWLGNGGRSVGEIRQDMTSSSEWVYTDEVEHYIKVRGITYKKETLWKVKDILTYLDQGMLLMCIDISKITQNKGDKSLLGKTSSLGTGHFIVASGYYQEDDKAYIEVLDPMNEGVRYYELEELYKAADSWWKQVFIFE